MNFRHWIAGLAAVAVAGLATSGFAQGVTSDRLLAAGSKAEEGNWLMVHKTYDANRYSTLDQINAGNVKGLHLAFAVALGGLEPAGFGVGAMEGTPLVNNGFMYVTDPWGTPYKIDVSSGKEGKVVWVCDTGVNKDPTRGILLASRGLALWNNLVIANLNDGRVIACDDSTGAIVWDQKIGKDLGEGFNAAPLVIKDKVLVGQSFGDWATRGWIAALDAKTGKEIWRFYTVPKPGDPGSETWKCDAAANPDCWKTGGGAAWVTGSYDPESNTVYWGSGNPVPMYDPEFRPGDNLYTDSSLALDLDTGKLKWYFQYTPGDYMDYDEVGVQLLVNEKIDGKDRKVLAHFGRNGIFYTLDRTNGQYISSGTYVSKLNWTKGIDPKTGQPMEYDPTKSLQTYAAGTITRAGAKATTCPNIQGGVNFFPTAYNPVTNVAYGAGIEGCSDLSVKTVAPADVKPGAIFIGGAGVSSGEQKGSITSIDVSTSKQIAKQGTPFPMYSGVLVTKDLVWSGALDGTFGAYDGKTLAPVWTMNVGTPFQAPPITYSVGGKEYIAIAGGGIGVAAFDRPELKIKQPANMIWVFTVD